VSSGGAGFIGSHACKVLHQAGFTPVTYDNLRVAIQKQSNGARSKSAIFSTGHG
jgi:UDP-glucose 4-epimerase